MRAVAIIVGALFGAMFMRGVAGLAAGAAIGYLFAEVLALRRRIERIEASARPEHVAAQVRPVTAEAVTKSEDTWPDAVPAQPQAPVEPIPEPTPVAETPTVTEAWVPEQPDARPAPAFNFDWLPQWLTGGNTVVRVGIVVLFFGVAFLLKYAAEHTKIPIEFRLAGVALGSIALLIAGIRLQKRRKGYGLSLEGGAIGILYLVVFAALRLYALLPPALAFTLLVAICALSAVLAVVQNSLALAVLGVAGGFLAPVLTSTGEGNHVQLFSYFAVLNAGILAIAWFRSWRLLNLVGFVFTFVIGGLWGIEYYRPEFFATTEPFLILFFLMYVATALLFAHRRTPNMQDPVDAALLFGVPIVGFALQSGLVRAFEYGLAWSALAVGAFYLVLAALLLRRGALRQLVEVFIALGVIFATLTIPLAVDGHWTAAAWAIEGAGILWVGLRQGRLAALGFGLLLQVGAALFFIKGQAIVGELAVFNSAYLGSLMIAVSGFISAMLMHRYRETTFLEGNGSITIAVLVWSALWWYFGAFNEIGLHVSTTYRGSAWLVLVAISLLLAEWIGTREQWRALRYAAALNILFLPSILIWMWMTQSHPMANLGLVVWPAVFAAIYFALWRHEQAELKFGLTGRHVLGFWLAFAIIALEVRWLVGEWLPSSDWAASAMGALLAAIVFLVHRAHNRVWPLRSLPEAYLGTGLAPVVVLAIAWIVVVGIARPGDPSPLPYLPILNPLDVASMLVMVTLYYWSMTIRPMLELQSEPLNLGFGVLGFAWANAVLFRALHHFGGLPYTIDGMLSSVLAQSAISIFWTSIALVLMLLAVRIRARFIWGVGAALLGLVVLKLFVVDLSNTGTVARIVSFVVVGLLLLVIGYVAPVPPREKVQTEAG